MCIRFNESNGFLMWGLFKIIYINELINYEIM